MSTSQNGYPAGNPALISTMTVTGTAVKLPVRNSSAGHLLIAAAARWNVEVEPLTVGWCWGYAFRTVRGSSTSLSNHASGTAIDLNAPKHPLGTAPSSNFTSAQIAAVRRIVADMAPCLRWGGDYSGRKDPMHVEVVASDAACATVLARLATPASAPAPSPVASPTVKDDDPMAPISLPVRPDGRFNAAVMAEAGSSSSVVARAWVTFGSTWGATHFKVCALDNTGAIMPGQQETDVANNRRAVLEVPSGAVMVTVEGHILGAASVPAAALVVQAK